MKRMMSVSILLVILMLLATGGTMNHLTEVVKWDPDTWSTVSKYAQHDSRFEPDMDEQCWKF